MLRLKDLFKIDFSSKGGGKLADKIFNKYNITKEEREEVKNEIASGGSGGDSEEVWYIVEPGYETNIADKIRSIITSIKAYYQIYNLGGYSIIYDSNLINFDMGYAIYGISFRPFTYEDRFNFGKIKGGTIEDVLASDIDEDSRYLIEDIKPYLRVSTKKEIEEYIKSILNN